MDLGGTNFRVLLIEIDGDKFKMDNAIYAVPEEIMLGPGAQLFDHIAECLATFSLGKTLFAVNKLPLTSSHLHSIGQWPKLS